MARARGQTCSSIIGIHQSISQGIHRSSDTRTRDKSLICTRSLAARIYLYTAIFCDEGNIAEDEREEKIRGKMFSLLDFPAAHAVGEGKIYIGLRARG